MIKKSSTGITPPVSLKMPEKNEIKATELLVETLTQHGQYETNDEAQQRQIVLGKLNAIFKDFVRTISIRNGLPEELANEVGGKIFTFGSYRLGVHGKAPKHVKREDFLEHVYEVLKARPEVTEITAVAEAFVPIIKMIFSNINIDLIFARLSESSVSDDLDLADDKLLRNIDERCVRSLNGSRVTDEILRLVPNVENFRTALRCVKVWAQRRAIYSNVMGFFGGVAWAIVVARVCQMFPNAAAGAIVSKFFRIMHEWQWPQPVLLKLIEEGPLAVRVWNPKIYPQDKSHRMPVITPAYPSMCSTHNVTQSTQLITTAEFGRAAEIADKILAGGESWSNLFEKSDFFHRYKYYLQVCASSDSADKQNKWAGLVESRLRQLIMKLELVENLDIAHPYIKGFERTVVCRTENQRALAQRGQSPVEGISDTADESAVIEDLSILTTTFYVGLAATPKDPSALTTRKMDISWPTQEFKKMVKSWDTFEEDSMGLTINYLKSSTLPLDVFDQCDIPRVLKKRNKQSNSALAATVDSNPAKKRRGSPLEQEALLDKKIDEVSELLLDVTTKVTPVEIVIEPVVVEPLKDGTLSYSEVVKNQEATRPTANYGGMIDSATAGYVKGLGIKLKMAKHH